MKLSIKTGSENYVAQVIKLPAKVIVKGFDRLVEVTYQGNNCLVSKDSPEDQLYLFFPAGSVLNPSYLSDNNLYRHSELNRDKSLTGLIDDSGRVKSVKMKGVISTGLIMPISSISPFGDPDKFNVGDAFNIIANEDFCTKYIIERKQGDFSGGQKAVKILDNIVDSKFFPEHYSTNHLLREVDKLSLDTEVVVTVKSHGTSLRVGNQLVTKKLSFKEKLAKRLGIPVITHKYAYVVGSRRALKSVDFKVMGFKEHYYSSDIWSKVAKEHLEGKLNSGESIYAEIIGKTYDGGAIQKNYDYGFDKPVLQIYRITNINPEGIEVDLSWNQMVTRATQIGVDTVIPVFKGRLDDFIKYSIIGNKQIPTEENKGELLEDIFYNELLEKKSIIGGDQIEEGFCIRIDSYPKTQNFKIKARSFILGESKGLDAGTADIESDN